MEKVLFDNLKQSLKEARAIRAGETSASRRFTVKPVETKPARSEKRPK